MTNFYSDENTDDDFKTEGFAMFIDILMNDLYDSYLYHPMKTNSTTGYLTSDYHVGCDFWAYIWNVYGQDTFKAMIPYHDTIEAIETVLDEDFRTVYREFLLSVLGSSGQPVEGQRIFPDAEQYQLEDSWSLLQALTLSVADGDPTSFIGGSVKDVDTEIAPLGFDVKVWYDNPDILTVNAEPGVEIYAFTASEYFLDYLNLLYGML